MIEFEDEVIGIGKLEVVQRGHEHDLGDGELLNPILVPFDS